MGSREALERIIFCMLKQRYAYNATARARIQDRLDDGTIRRVLREELVRLAETDPSVPGGEVVDAAVECGLEEWAEEAAVALTDTDSVGSSQRLRNLLGRVVAQVLDEAEIRRF